MKGYSTREVAELLHIPDSRVRAFARAGFLKPVRGDRQEYRFTFQDIVLLRAAKALDEAQVPSRKVFKALRSLQAQLPGDRSLAAVRITAIGDDVIVRDAAAAWNADTGQAVIDFDVASLAAEAAPMVRHAASAAREESDHTAEDWFATAVDLELVGETARAIGAYQRVLGLDWDHTPARINLGRLYHDQGQLPDAERLYREALAKDDTDALAWFNLGVVLEDQHHTEAAQEAYEKAVALDHDFADAHYNLSSICERTGQLAMALKHLLRYKSLSK